MVKFSKYLASHLVPEWRPAFCDYWSLKKELKRIKALRNVEYRVLEKDAYIALRGPSLRKIRARSPRPQVILVHKKSSDIYGSRLDLVETELLINSAQAKGEKPFFKRLDAELNKVIEFYKTKEKEFLQHADILDEQMHSLFELKLVVENRKSFAAQRRTCGDEDLVTSLNRDDLNEQSVDVMDSVVSLHNEMLFQTITNQNAMVKSGLPSKDQLSSMTEKFGDISARSASETLHLIQGHAASSQDWQDVSHSTMKSTSSLFRSLSEDVSKATVEFKSSSTQEFSAFKKKVQHSEKMLREAFIEFYRGLSLLKSYSSLNMIAFTKILKKYEKATERGASSTYLRTVDNSYFQTSDKVTKLIIWVEAMFTDYFSGGDRHRAREALKPVQARRPLRITFFLGMFSGCSVMLVLAFASVVHVLSANLTDSEQADKINQYMNSVFPVFSMVALLLLHLYMYGWNLYLWQGTRINYPFIFEFDAGTALSYPEVLLVCTSLTVVLGGGMLGHLASYYSESIMIDLIPLGIVLAIFGVLLCPFGICYLSARRFFVKCMWRVVCAPFYKVFLADFFLGDQLCSQVPMLRNLEYVLCYYASGHFKTDNGEACIKNDLFIQVSYMIAVLPYWWRVMQCLRRYQDEKSRSHLANGGKYLSAIIVVFTRIQYGKTDSLNWTVLYIVASTFATVYQIYWDLVIDWGLLRSNSVNPWLREKLILEDHRYIYFISMVLPGTERYLTVPMGAIYHTLSIWRSRQSHYGVRLGRRGNLSEGSLEFLQIGERASEQRRTLQGDKNCTSSFRPLEPISSSFVAPVSNKIGQAGPQKPYPSNPVRHCDQMWDVSATGSPALEDSQLGVSISSQRLSELIDLAGHPQQSGVIARLFHSWVGSEVQAVDFFPWWILRPSFLVVAYLTTVL